MDLRTFTVGTSKNALADTAVINPSNGELVFVSVSGYNSIITEISRELNKRGTGYLQGYGRFSVGYKEYEVFKSKDANSDYAHLVAYKKDKTRVEKDQRETVLVNCFIEMENEANLRNIVGYQGIPDVLADAVYNKLNKFTPVPLLKEWSKYITYELSSRRHLRMNRVVKQKDSKMYSYNINVPVENLYAIIKKGFDEGVLKVNGCEEVSDIMQSVQGIDSYLNPLSQQLTDVIENSFKSKFNPAVDTYSEGTKLFNDYSSYKGLNLYNAQLNVIESSARNLHKSKSSLIIAEPGSGKTMMGMGTLVADIVNTGKKATFSIVLCPSHLTLKWQSEIKKYFPLAEVEIVKDFTHFLEIKRRVNDPKRLKHLIMIISKGAAKNSYDKRPAAVWSQSKRAYTCPHCGHVLTKTETIGSGRNKIEREVPLTFEDFLKTNKDNQICKNEIDVYDKKKKVNEKVPCHTKLWTVHNKQAKTDWMRLPDGKGWIQKRHLQYLIDKYEAKSNGADKPDRKEVAFLSALLEAQERIENNEEVTRAPRNYAISKYVKKHMKNKVDYLIVDELHEYKGGDTDQGLVLAELATASKKTLGLTGTLLNGYADGLYYILYRLFPTQMKEEGFFYEDENEFTLRYGVVRKTNTFFVDANGNQTSKGGKSKHKKLPGVSPIVFTKFLLNNAVFLSLSDISEGLPTYTETPIGVTMDKELSDAYKLLEDKFRSVSSSHYSKGGTKAMGALLQTLSVYPDQPYDQPPIIHPETGDVVISPSALSDTIRAKDERFLELVKEKVDAGEKVLVYYSWTNRTNLGERLPKLLKENGIKAATLKSSTVNAEGRAAWIDKKLDDGLQVLICNPTLVETGLDLLQFTSIIFYQIGYNLFTLRQASRRSLRLNQTKDINVYFLYYKDTIQEQAISLMATKLQASQAIEGKFSEEGLNAMSNNEDLLTQIANSIVQGIQNTVDESKFEGYHNEILEGLTEDIAREQAMKTFKEQSERVVIEHRDYHKGNFASYSIVMSKPVKKRRRKHHVEEPLNRATTNVFMRDLFSNKLNVANL